MKSIIATFVKFVIVAIAVSGCDDYKSRYQSTVSELGKCRDDLCAMERRHSDNESRVESLKSECQDVEHKKKNCTEQIKRIETAVTKWSELVANKKMEKEQALIAAQNKAKKELEDKLAREELNRKRSMPIAKIPKESIERDNVVRECCPDSIAGIKFGALRPEGSRETLDRIDGYKKLNNVFAGDLHAEYCGFKKYLVNTEDISFSAYHGRMRSCFTITDQAVRKVQLYKEVEGVKSKIDAPIIDREIAAVRQKIENNLGIKFNRMGNWFSNPNFKIRIKWLSKGGDPGHAMDHAAELTNGVNKIAVEFSWNGYKTVDLFKEVMKDKTRYNSDEYDMDFRDSLIGEGNDGYYGTGIEIIEKINGKQMDHFSVTTNRFGRTKEEQKKYEEEIIPPPQCLGYTFGDRYIPSELHDYPFRFAYTIESHKLNVLNLEHQFLGFTEAALGLTVEYGSVYKIVLAKEFTHSDYNAPEVLALSAKLRDVLERKYGVLMDCKSGYPEFKFANNYFKISCEWEKYDGRSWLVLQIGNYDVFFGDKRKYRNEKTQLQQKGIASDEDVNKL